jgi:hypothetical protein
VRNVRVKVAVGVMVAATTSVAHGDDVTLFEDQIAPASHWTIGVTLDRRISSRPTRADLGGLGDPSRIGDQLLGVSATYERSRFGINGRLVFLPQTLSPRTTLGGVLGARARLAVSGREITLGANVQADAVFGDHHWILYVSPAEVGVDVYTRRSFRLQVVAGARYALAGNIIRNVVIDPNGFPHDVFVMTKDAKLEHPWEGTITAVFARRID